MPRLHLATLLPACAILSLIAAPIPSFAQASRGQDDRSSISPHLRINHPPRRGTKRREPPGDPGVRSIDGSNNNLADPEMGATFSQLLRLVKSDYVDGTAELTGSFRPNPRVISNGVNSQADSRLIRRQASDFLWQWGQFLDHDVDLTDGTDPPEPANIAVPAGDPYFDPDGSGLAEIHFNRSIYDEATGDGPGNPRQQLNEVTAWIDASNVYGSDSDRALALRTLDGTGRLRTSEGDLLPFNSDGLPNAGGPDATLFLGGDVRANEQVGLTALHTLFVREHNRLAARIAERNSGLTGDQNYERSRAMVGAQMQVITYQEFLPALLGPDAIAPYQGYDPDVDAGISNIFSTAAYRFGHSALSPTLLRLDADGNEIAQGNLALRDAFFAPRRIIDEGGIEPLLRGLASQVCQAIDPYVIDDVRNFLFGDPGSDGFDLVSLNIQRGRDHGLPSYNGTRRALGLAPARSFADISLSSDVQDRLASTYEDVEDVDLWVGGLAEDPRRGAHVGELISVVLKNQFEALRDGDRFWYERTLSDRQIEQVEATRLSDIIRRNTEIAGEIPDDVFHVRNERRERNRNRQ